MRDLLVACVLCRMYLCLVSEVCRVVCLFVTESGGAGGGAPSSTGPGSAGSSEAPEGRVRGQQEGQGAGAPAGDRESWVRHAGC